MSNKEQILEETIRKLKEENYLLKEMARDRDYIIKKLEENDDQVIYHLIYCYLWKNTNNNFNHWCDEIHANLNTVSRWKNTNKFPTYDKLYKWYLEDRIEKTNDHIDARVRDACHYESIDDINQIPKYDSKKLANYVNSYFEWLIKTLSEKGTVENSEVNNKVRELLNL